MKLTTPKKLRAELKTFLEKAEKEPIKIARRSGKKFILTTENDYIKLKKIINILQNKVYELLPDFKLEIPEMIAEEVKSLTKKKTKKIAKKITKKTKKKRA